MAKKIKETPPGLPGVPLERRPVKVEKDTSKADLELEKTRLYDYVLGRAREEERYSPKTLSLARKQFTELLKQKGIEGNLSELEQAGKMPPDVKQAWETLKRFTRAKPSAGGAAPGGPDVTFINKALRGKVKKELAERIQHIIKISRLSKYGLLRTFIKGELGREYPEICFMIIKELAETDYKNNWGVTFGSDFKDVPLETVAALLQR